MAVKTFTTGNVLTASDTNTYLANSGLVYITSATIGSGVSNATVSGAFSSTYDDYLITIEGGVGSSNVEINCRLGSATTNYKWSILYSTYLASSALAIANNASSYFQYVGRSTTSTLTATFQLRQPNLAKPTYCSCNYVAEDAAGVFNGILNDTTQYTAFTVAPTIGTLTGGTITVYGYRKA